MNTNRLGLSRVIPAEIRRKIRQNSKQGCIICREIICDYHHFEPEFADAASHNADGICLLCPRHHAEVTRGRLTNTQVKAAYLQVRTSQNIRPPYYQPQINGPLRLELGDSVFEHMPDDSCVLRYAQERVISVSYKRDEIFGGSYPSISGKILDEHGNPILTLEDNTIVLSSTKLDVEVKGRLLMFKNEKNSIDMSLEIDPPNGMKINRLFMRHRDVLLNLDRNFGAIVPVGRQRYAVELPGIQATNAISAIRYDPNPKKWRNDILFEARGGEGLFFRYGVTMAEKAGAVLIKRIVMRPYGSA